MDFILFMVLGMLEIYALFAFMFKSFRLPYKEYLMEITVISLFVVAVSYVIRVWFEAGVLIDIATHFVLYILFFRYLIKVRVWRAIVICLLYFVYGFINIGIYLIYAKLGVFSESVIAESTGLAAYVIQITTIITVSMFSYLLYAKGWGFSFVIRPPHDFFVKKKMKQSEMIIANSVIIAGVLLMGSFFLMMHSNYIVLPLNLISIVAVIYLAYRRDMANDRSYRIARTQSGQDDKEMES